MRRIFMIAFALVLIAGLAILTCAVETTARVITPSTVITGNPDENYSFLADGIEYESQFLTGELSFHNEAGIGSMYLVFDVPCSFTVVNKENGQSYTQCNQGFLHVFTDLEGNFGYAPREISIRFTEAVWLAEVQVFSSGEVPDTVQCWEQPLNGSADIVLFSTHGDDEQLYFAGLLPYYAVERDLKVQVVYMTNHVTLNGSVRQHEMLNGLWAVGIRAYPVFGSFPDFKILSKDGTYEEYENLGFSHSDLLRFVVENIRRFKPLVAVGHDLDGEYGHGMHMVYADLLTQAVEIGADPQTFPELAERYGIWDVPKTYLHLYPGNALVMDWDQPLESFGGMTAFEVTQKYGFPCHVSQQYELYTHWLYGEEGEIARASQIEEWSPCFFGLYRSTVGEDIQKNDFMENLTSYEEIFLEADVREENRRSIVLTAQEKQKVEAKLLRNPEEEKFDFNQKQNAFPVFSMMISLCAVVGIAVLLKKVKISEKK